LIQAYCRALEIARRKKAEGDVAGAIKFARKSQSLYSSAQAEIFLSSLSEAETANGSAFATGASTGSSSTANEATPQSRKKDTEHRQGRQNTEFTSEQIAVVERVRKCQHHEYYDILELKKEATDSEIKKRLRCYGMNLTKLPKISIAITSR
jgi:DnaJ homolog subfamily B member 12